MQRTEERKEEKREPHSEALIINLCRHILEPAQERDLRLLVGASQDAPILGLSELPQELRERLLASPSNEYELWKVAFQTWKAIRELWVSKGNPRRLLIHLPIGSPAFMWALQSALLRIADPEMREAIIIAFSHSERLVEVREGKKITSFRYSHLITFTGAEIFGSQDWGF